MLVIHYVTVVYTYIYLDNSLFKQRCRMGSLTTYKVSVMYSNICKNTSRKLIIIC